MSWSLVRAVLLCSLAVIGSSSRSVQNEPPPNQDPFELNDAEEAGVEAGHEVDEVQLDLGDVTEDLQYGLSLLSLPYREEGSKQVHKESDKSDGESTSGDNVGHQGGTNHFGHERFLSSCSSGHIAPLLEMPGASHDVQDFVSAAEQTLEEIPSGMNPTRCMAMPREDATASGGKLEKNFGGKSPEPAKSDIDPYMSCSQSGVPKSSNNITHSQGCFSSLDTITHMSRFYEGNFSDTNQTTSTPENCVFCNKSRVMICSGSQVKHVPSFMEVPNDLNYLIFDKTEILFLDSESIQKFPRTETLALLNGLLFKVEFAPLLTRVLKEIVIVNNSLSGLNFSWFFDSRGNNTSTITTLNMMDNMIAYLPNPYTGTDPVLPNLQTVILSNNPLKVLPVHVFRPLRNSQVKCLSLRSCCLQDFGSNDDISSPLQYLSKLQTLDLSENFLLGTERLAGLLAPLSSGNLTTLRLSGNSYLYIPTQALQHVSHSLKILDLHSSSISCLDVTSFPFMPKLETLNLDFSRITSILSSTFTTIPFLRTLTLEGNGLLFVPPAIRLPSLTHLSLSNNPRTEDSQGKYTFSLGMTSFVGMTNLISLNLAEIPVVSLKMDQFSGLTCLTELSLNATSLETIEPGSFRGLQNLQKLYLNKNMLTNLQNGTFEGLENLLLLDLSNNRVTFTTSLVTPVGGNLTSRFTQEAPEKDTSQKRSKRSIKVCLPNEASCNENPPRVSLFKPNEIFYFTPNDITHANALKASAEPAVNRNMDEPNRIPTGESTSVSKSQNVLQNDWPFTDLINLEILILNDNRITGMIPIFDELHNLTALDLGSNKIFEWVERLFSGCTNLEELNLKDNQIRTLTEAMVQDFSSASLDKINLISNHLECSCDLSPFLEDLNAEQFVDFEYYECSTGRSILQLTAYLTELANTNCDVAEDPLSTYNLPSVILAGGLCAVALISLIWFVHHRYRRKPVLVVTNTESLDLELDTQVEYDVFVCYAFPEKRWVFDVLLPFFEQQLELRVCVHERDFQAGDLITENIENSIKQSRKVLFVLSRAFLASQWCQYELSRASMLALNRSTLLVLEKERIPKDEQPSNLQSLLATRTFIPWSEESEEQRLVWEKFRKVLIPPQSRRQTPKDEKKSGIRILREFLQLGSKTMPSPHNLPGTSDIVPTHQSFRKLGLGEDVPQKGAVHMVTISGKENPSFERSPTLSLQSIDWRETGGLQSD